MKVKRDDTEKARRYWRAIEENHEVVARWPDWKQNSPDRKTSPDAAAEADGATTGREAGRNE